MEYIGKQEREKFLFKVKHPQHGETSVTAEDRLHAVVEAAHRWGIMKWTSIARACEIVNLGPAPKEQEKPKKRTAKRGTKKGEANEHQTE